MVSVGMVAYRNGGQDFATDYAKSILLWEPSAQVVMVDSNSTPPYRKNKRYKVIRMLYAENERYNYAKSLNTLINNMDGDWLVYGNDDVLCTGSFIEEVEALDRRAVYGVDLAINRNLISGIPIYHIYGWIVIMHRSIIDKVGWYDEGFTGGNLDDVDYGFRAAQKLVAVNRVDLPFIHLDSMRRKTAGGFRVDALANRKKFLRKHGYING